MAFANDPLNLQATDGPTDVQKGDSDAAAWLPPNKSFHCNYVARQISVKATYELWVTQAEHDAMARVLADCAGQLVPTSEKEVAVAAAAETSKAPEPAAKAAVVVPAPAGTRTCSSAGACVRTGACACSGALCSTGTRACAICTAGTGARGSVLRQLHRGETSRGRPDLCRPARLQPQARP